MILTADKTQKVTVKRTRLLDFAVWPLGHRESVQIVRAKDQYDALWDAFQVSGMQLKDRYMKSNLPYDSTKTYLLDLNRTEYVVKRITQLELDTVYA